VRTWKNVIGCCFSLLLGCGYSIFKLRYNMRNVIYIYMCFVLLEVTSAVSCSTVQEIYCATIVHTRLGRGRDINITKHIAVVKTLKVISS